MIYSLKLDTALSLAIQAHRFQYRKGNGVPYIKHVLDVVDFLAEIGIKRDDHWDVWCAAYLHDVKEDHRQFWYRHAIETDSLGEGVSKWVDELTHDTNIAKDDYLKTFKYASIEALVIKLADRYCNVIDFKKHGNDDYWKKYLKKAECVYDLLHPFNGRRDSIIIRFGSATYDALYAKYENLKELACQ